MNLTRLYCTLKKFVIISFIFISAKNISAQTCNNWLNIAVAPGFVEVGEIDIPGTQLTIEAAFVRTTPYYLNNYLYAGDLVSKHNSPANVNYLLRPNSAEITTSDGYFIASSPCLFEFNKTYHVAMTYDGSNLKFYRNGFLMNQVAATGNLFQNNYKTTIGLLDAGGAIENLIGYINEVRIWNVVRTQSEIRMYMNTSIPNPTTQTGLMAYYTFDNLLNKQGNSAFNGTTGGSAIINQANPYCDFVADSCGYIECSAKTDFDIKQDACAPFSLQLSTYETNYNSIKWDFGDGNSVTGSSVANHTYTIAGTYKVKMIKNFSTCSDTATKDIIVGNIYDNQVIQTQDTTICTGNTKQLKSIPALSYCWSPSANLDNPTSQNPITNSPGNITYYLTAQTTGINLITNGDFSNGNTGFTSFYIYSPSSGINSGLYNVGNSSTTWNAGLSNCKDHTTSSGNMLMVNGSAGKNMKVWSQTIPVTPNTTYVFSAWVQSLGYTNPSSLQFAVNGVNQGAVFNANNTTCIWDKHFVLWNSGDSSNAEISIVTQNQLSNGNEFAIDDIVFAPVYMKYDSVQVKVANEKLSISGNTSVCEGGTVHLNASGGISYLWSPGNTLSNTTIANPVAAPLTTTKYVVTGKTLSGCDSKDSINIIVYKKPTITKTADTSICSNTSVQLLAGGGVNYLWAPFSTLNNAAIPNPVATPTQNTTYIVAVTDNHLCTNTDSVKITIKAKPVFGINESKSICEKESVILSASGGSIYHWDPSSTLNNPDIASPVANPTTTTNYTVNITETTCNTTSSLSTTITVHPLPVLQLSKSNDIDCSQNYSQLNVSGANTYLWSPALSLNNTSISNPIASPIVPTMYNVTGTNNFGCSSTDSILVDIKNSNQGLYLMPNAFTPNNDGLNDCYGIKLWGILTDVEFSVFNRWGQRLFFTTNPNQCWDGMYKGINQNADTYIYFIKAKSVCAGNIVKRGYFLLIR
ncbi:MAG: gliding motility-associated C-terminal domain-containing protein [Lacibacter sp.]